MADTNPFCRQYQFSSHTLTVSNGTAKWDFTLTDTCQVTLASFKATSDHYCNNQPDHCNGPQVLHDKVKDVLGPGHYVMTVSIPDCFYQVDGILNHGVSTRVLDTATGGHNACQPESTTTTIPSTTTTEAPSTTTTVLAPTTTTTTERPTTTILGANPTTTAAPAIGTAISVMAPTPKQPELAATGFGHGDMALMGFAVVLAGIVTKAKGRRLARR